MRRRRAAGHPGAAPARRQRGQAHPRRRHDRHRVVVRRRVGRGSGCATPGPACRPTDREQIFERFGRGAVPESDEGFGLGLSIVRAIAVAHGGGVEVEDATPRGARFVITLPAIASRATRPRQEGPRGPHPDRRGRGADRLVRGQGPARRGPPDDRGRRRPRGPRPRPERRLRPGGARHRAARHRRLRGARPAALPGVAGAGDRADRPRLGDRHGLRARGRGRRLHAQAVPVRRAARPGPAAAAAGRTERRHRRREDAIEAGGVRLDLRTRRATVGRQGGRPVGTRVHARRDLHAERRPGALPRAAARPRLGPRLRPRLQRGRRLRRLPAQEVRRRRDRHRARDGLPLRPQRV